MRTQVKGMKKFVFALLAVAMIFCLAACNSGDGAPSDAGGETAADVMKKVQENMASVSSMSSNMDVTIAMSAEGQTIDISTSGQVDYTVDPMVMKMDISMDMGDVGAVNMLMYALQEGDGYVSYTQTAQDPTWYKQTLADMDALTQYDAQANMELYLDNSSEFKEVGTETINEKEVVRYDGVIGKDALGDVIATSGAFDQLGLDEATLESLVAELGEIPISFWVDKENYQMVRYGMDMTKVMQNLMDNLMESQGVTGEITIDGVSVSMTINSINEISSIELPAETENAVPMAQ